MLNQTVAVVYVLYSIISRDQSNQSIEIQANQIDTLFTVELLKNQRSIIFINVHLFYLRKSISQLVSLDHPYILLVAKIATTI